MSAAPCTECDGKGHVVIGIGLPGNEWVPGGTRVEYCDRCLGTGRLRGWGLVPGPDGEPVFGEYEVGDCCEAGE